MGIGNSDIRELENSGNREFEIREIRELEFLIFNVLIFVCFRLLSCVFVCFRVLSCAPVKNLGIWDSDIRELENPGNCHFGNLGNREF